VGGRELGAHLAHAIAQRDDKIEGLRREFSEMLRAAAAKINATFVHDAHRLWVELLGMAARAISLDRSMR
jgi:hypothetical protein